MYKLFKILLLCVLLNACVYSVESTTLKGDAPSDIPDVTQLKMRVKQLYEAIIKKDWYTYYYISIFSLKKGVFKESHLSYKELEENFNKGENDSKTEIISWDIKKITLRTDKMKEHNLDMPCVEVEMNIVLKYNSNGPEKIREHKDGWIYIDNTWYLSGHGPS
jgi:hypothetical protein